MQISCLCRFSECQTALGVENGTIPDGQLSASSEWDFNHAASQGRLNFKATSVKAGSWSAKTNDVNQWLQVDLGTQYTKVTRVATQGRNGFSQWVTKYTLQYSKDGVNFQDYKEQGQNAFKVTKNDKNQNVFILRHFNAPFNKGNSLIYH